MSIKNNAFAILIIEAFGNNIDYRTQYGNCGSYFLNIT